MTQVPAPAPAAPPAAPAPAADPGQAALDRIAAAFPEGNQPGTPIEQTSAAPAPAEGAVPEAEVDLFSDESLDQIDFGDMPYRQGAKLKNELFKTRDRFRPLQEAFGTLDEDQRTLLLQSAPALGTDLAALAASAAGIHPDDVAYFIEAMQMLAADPAKGAEKLAEGAAKIREWAATQAGTATAPAPAAVPAVPAPGTSPMPEWADPNAPPIPPAEQPITRTELEQFYREQEAGRAQADLNRQAMEEVQREAAELGYDPQAVRGTTEFRQFDRLLAIAQEPGVGSLVKAHEILAAEDQAVIDRFVEGKADGSARPVPSPGGGVTPVETRQLETLADGNAAMQERLNAHLGPDPRRRAADD